MRVQTHQSAPPAWHKSSRFTSFFPISVLLLSMFVAACGSSSATASGTLVIGFPASLTGSFATEGKLTYEGYKLWADQVNKNGGIKVGNTSYQVQLKYYDDGSNPTTSAQLTQQLITTDKVNFLFSSYGTPNTLQDAAIAEQFQIPLVDSNGASSAIFSKGYKYTFGVLSPASTYAAIMLQAALSQSNPPTTVAILSADDAFSSAVAAAAKEYGNSINLKVVFSQQYPSGATDLNNVLSAMMAANGNKAPDFILGSGHESEAITIMKEAKLQNINPKLFGFTVGPGTPDFITTLGNDANDVISSSQWTPQVSYTGTDVFKTAKNFEQLYVAAYGHEPAYQSADAAASGIALQNAIQNAGSIDPKKVRDALANLDVMTFYGQLKFNAQGQNTFKPMVTIQIQNGKVVTVYPANVANAAMVYPSPAFGIR